MPDAAPLPPGPSFPDPQMNLLTPSAPGQGRVISNEICLKGKSASFVRHTVLDVSGTPMAGRFLAGQAFGVIAPGQDENGKAHRIRLYSISSPSWGEDGAGAVLATTPKRLIVEQEAHRAGDDPNDRSLVTGVCSNYMCDLQPGEEVTITGPVGKRFLLPSEQDAYNYIFAATGTGVAPFRGMVMELFSRPDRPPCPNPVHLIMGARYTTDLLYDDLFTSTADKHSNFGYHAAISREARSGGRGGVYVHDLLREQLDQFRDILAAPNTLLYICGTAGMDHGLYRVLAETGLADQYVTLAAELTAVDPADWTPEAIRKFARPTPRCMVEVY